MNKLLVTLCQMLLVISLMSAPSSVTPCVAATSVSQSDMSCCGPSCPCPTGKVCTQTAAPITDRAIAQNHVQIPVRILANVFSQHTIWRSFSAQSVSLTKMEVRPPPLVIGSPPQAKLRVWLI